MGTSHFDYQTKLPLIHQKVEREIHKLLMSNNESKVVM